MRARGRWRAVDVVDRDIGVVDLGVDGDDFQVLVVVGEGGIQRRKADGVVDEDGHASPIATPRTITA